MPRWPAGREREARRKRTYAIRTCCQTSTWREAELLLERSCCSKHLTRDAASPPALRAPKVSAAREVDGVIGVLTAAAGMFEVARLGPEADRTD